MHAYVRGGFIAFAVAASLTVAGCGADAEPKQAKPGATSQPQQQPKQPSESAGEDTEAPAETLAVAQGAKGVELRIESAERDAGGFLTIKGRISNASGATVVLPAEIRGDETEVVKHGMSLGGATLLDAVGKKRYYVLRDTDGRPLTTSGLDTLGAGKSTAVFMQFPAPPATTTEVSFQLPTFEPATLKLS
ncbi:hypothetical protein ACIQRS_03095 [Streptomyces termitum]|uniref:Secreted protein n=1 Tax=Streptomyces termitum TaxID=67368 RepID=A0A918SUH0_9ACTN|nr:hypothetical protein [Streptomyces termitum]GHA72002.1 hypothetical protein GCM10010305_12790 [Streptomyces termitum]